MSRAGVGDKSGSRVSVKQKRQEDVMSDPKKNLMFYALVIIVVVSVAALLSAYA